MGFPEFQRTRCRSELAAGGVPTMVVNDNAHCLNVRVALTFFASKLAPTGKRFNSRLVSGFPARAPPPAAPGSAPAPA
ncbi:hypothetical protein C1X61_15995 [Pseudomonas sp. FW215-T2]|nr:hypothetical protein C1X61_15995 [Pseudomonas sp. FW215-T2]PNA09353.1 hypothetical protein C1X62_21760 [Pseudomonas sp. FW215-R3]PNB35531.1 hypothetical protein C1X63_22195 [Pseudomonas sp. FW305-131]